MSHRAANAPIFKGGKQVRVSTAGILSYSHEQYIQYIKGNKSMPRGTIGMVCESSVRPFFLLLLFLFGWAKILLEDLD